MSEIEDYVQAARAAGEQDSEIKDKLVAAGWDMPRVDEALAVATAGPVLSTPPPVAKVDKAQIWKYAKIGLVVLGAAAIILGGFKSYSYFSSNPEKIWQQTAANMLKIKSAHFNFELSYAETVSKDDSSDFTGFLGVDGEVKVAVSGNGNMAIKTDQLDADYDMDSTLSTRLGGLNISIDFLSRKIGDYAYYKLNGNPLAALFGGSGDNKPSDWVKISLKDNANQDLNILESQKNEILDAYKKAKLMKPTKLLGTETINGTSTWHYEAALDKQELKNYFTRVQTIIDSKDNTDLSSLADKIQFQKLELWIGKSDHRLYQAVMESNFPSLLHISDGSATTKARDARRIADARQLQTALELFYNDNNRYPAASPTGEISMSDGNMKFSTYISTYPQAPAPADGGCTETNNKYLYEQVGGGQDYKLTFCLGNDVSGYKAGVLQATSKGMQTLLPMIAPASNTWKDISFTGAISLKIGLSDYDKPVKIDEPTGNISDPYRDSRDARRLSDIRQIQTGLELFYNDNARYPSAGSNGEVSATDGSPRFSTYISTYPQAPTPADGSCTDTNNKYVYQQLNGGQDYRLSFCLGHNLSSYKAGPLEASVSGIK